MGCGGGIATAALAGLGYHVTGVDPSAPSLEEVAPSLSLPPSLPPSLTPSRTPSRTRSLTASLTASLTLSLSLSLSLSPTFILTLRRRARTRGG